VKRRLSFYNTEVATEHYLGMRWPRAVWESVLTQAIDDIVYGPDPVEQLPVEVAGEISEAAEAWVDDPLNEPRRFVWVCEQLDLDPAAVRAAINRKKGRQ
jgi:hypothetical protein